MKQLVYLSIFFFFNSGFFYAQSGEPAGFIAGAAEIKINPAPGTYLAGYNLNRKSTGIHDDLFVKAVVITNNQTTISIVTIDCIGLPYPTVQRIREAVTEKIPAAVIQPDHLVVSSTHTHSGPDLIGLWGEDLQHSGIDSLYEDAVIAAAATAVIQAWKKRQKVTIQYATTSFGDGWVENISVPEELDKQVVVLQLLNSKNKNMATLVNFACHPTILGKENTQSSADFPAGFYKQLKQKIGGVNLYLQGAIGGWVQPEHVEKNFSEAEKKGKELADAVIKALQQPGTINGNQLQFAARQFEMPVSNLQLQQLAAAGVIKRDIAEGTLTEIAWFSIGEAKFATHPGESSPIYSLATKNIMKTNGPKFILGLGMDELGYILQPDFFDKTKSLHATPYLTSMSPGAEAGPAMMRVIQELAEENP